MDYMLCVMFFLFIKGKEENLFYWADKRAQNGFWHMLHMGAIKNYPCSQGEKNKGILMDQRRENGEKGGSGTPREAELVR